MKNRIKELRQEAGLSQMQLAKTSGTSQTVISKLELNKQNMTDVQMTRLAKALDVHPSELIVAQEWGAAHSTKFNDPLTRAITRAVAKLIRKYPALTDDNAADITALLHQQYVARVITPTLIKSIEADAALLAKHEIAKHG